MRLKTKVKQAGRKNNILAEKDLMLENRPQTLSELIEEVVKDNVEEYRNSNKNTMITYLTEREISDNAEVGKVSFGVDRKPVELDTSEAIENALIAFEDGLYYVFINEERMENLGENLSLKDGDEVLFVRFVMLAGRMW